MTFDADLDFLGEEVDRSRSNRKKIQSLLSGNAKYLRIKDNSKAPSSSFAQGRRNRLKNIPKEGNYGIIPENKLFILDFDCHNEGFSSIDEQIDFFSNFFKIDLRKSFSVVTQTGGIHVYLLFPDNVDDFSVDDFPKASLRSYSQAFSIFSGKEIKLDADIRSGLVNGYVVGPESYSSIVNTIHEKYWVADNTVGFDMNDDFTILSVSHESLENLKKVVKLRETLQNSTVDELGRKRHEDALKALSVSPGYEPVEKTKVKPPIEILSRLKNSINSKNLASYHSKRAFAKAALHCCYEDYAIAIACIEMGIDKDSYTKNSVGFRYLLSDLKKFTPDNRYHGFYCDQGKKNLKTLKENDYKDIRYDTEFNLEDFKKKVQKKIEERSFSRSSYRVINPRVLDVGKISSKILKEKKKMNPPQQYFDAMMIVDYFLQPLSNVGASRVLLARTAICERLNMSPSQATQALRLLRDNNVILVEERQRTGLAPTYSVSSDFTNNYLTKALRLSWGRLNKGLPREESDSIYFDRSSRVFRKVFENDEVNMLSSISSAWEDVLNKALSPLPSVSFKSFSSGAALSYLKSEAARHKSSPVVIEDMIVDDSTGEIVSEIS